MLPPAGIFPQPVAGLHQRRDHRRDLPGIDQVVEHHRQVGIGDEVVAVVDHHQRIGPLRIVPRRQVDPHVAHLAEGAALDLQSPRSAPPAPRAAGSTPAARSRACRATEFSPNGSPARAGLSGSTISASCPCRPTASLYSNRPPSSTGSRSSQRSVPASRTNGSRLPPPWIQRTRCTCVRLAPPGEGQHPRLRQRKLPLVEEGVDRLAVRPARRRASPGPDAGPDPRARASSAHSYSSHRSTSCSCGPRLRACPRSACHIGTRAPDTTRLKVVLHFPPMRRSAPTASRRLRRQASERPRLSQALTPARSRCAPSVGTELGAHRAYHGAAAHAVRHRSPSHALQSG